MVLIMNKLATSEHPFVPVTLGTSTEPSSPAPIHALPDEVMIHIFSGLNAQELTTCSSVCRQWCGLSQDQFLWKNLFISRFPTCNHLGIDDFQKAYQDQLHLYSNFANGVYASHTLTGHTGKVYSLAVVDGKLISGSSDDTIKVWDLETHKCVHTLTGHTSTVYSLAVVDGKLISGSSDDTIKVWDLETHKCVHTLTGHTGTVYSLAVVDGKLISGSWDRTIRVWDLETQECAHTLTGNTGTVYSLAVVDGKLISSSSDDTIKVWDLETQECAHTLTGHTGTVYSLAVVDGKLISGSDDDTIKVWDLETHKCVHTLTGHTNTVYSLAVVDGKLISGSSDDTIKVWDLETHKCVHTLTEHMGGVSSLAVVDGKLISGSGDDTIKVWDFKATNDEILKEIADLFMNGDATAMDRFSRMSQKEKNEIYGELYKIIKPSLSRDYFGCAEHAFLGTEGLSSTPQQKAQAIQNYLLRKTAKLFEGDGYDCKKAMERFLRLPKEVRGQVYGELFMILNPSSPYPLYGEHAFHSLEGLSATPNQKAQAIYNYLNRRTG